MMWVSYQRLADPAIPRHLLQSDPELRRPMVPRIRQTQHHPVVPKTVVTLYREEEEGDGNGHRSPQTIVTTTTTTPTTLWSWFRRQLKHSVSPQNSGAQLKDQSVPSPPASPSWIHQFLHDPNSNSLTLLLMALDVLVNTLMLVLNYTTLVIDFFDNIDWSTVQTRIDLSATASEQEIGEHYYVQRLNSRRSTLAKLNMLLYMLVYIAQAVGFYGVVRGREGLLTAYVTQLAIQIIVLVFTIILRPFWASVCLLRIVLFALVLKLCLKLSDRNVHLVWDFDCNSNNNNQGENHLHASANRGDTAGGSAPDDNPNVTSFRPLSVAAREEQLARSGRNLQVLMAPRPAHGSFRHRRRPSSVSGALSTKSSLSSTSTLCFDAEPAAEQLQQQQQQQLRMSTPILATAAAAADAADGEHDSSGALFARPQTAAASTGSVGEHHRQPSTPNEQQLLVLESKQNKKESTTKESSSHHGSLSSLDSTSAKVMEVMANINHVLTVPSSLPTAFTTFEAQPLDSAEELN